MMCLEYLKILWVLVIQLLVEDQLDLWCVVAF